MKILPDPTEFEWDEGNIDKNLIKHNVTNEEAENIFISNRPIVVLYDKTHSISENRYNVLGKTDKERKLFISFTLRNKRVRIISARDMSRKERRVYAKKTKDAAKI